MNPKDLDYGEYQTHSSAYRSLALSYEVLGLVILSYFYLRAIISVGESVMYSLTSQSDVSAIWPIPEVYAQVDNVEFVEDDRGTIMVVAVVYLIAFFNVCGPPVFVIFRKL